MPIDPDTLIATTVALVADKLLNQLKDPNFLSGIAADVKNLLQPTATDACDDQVLNDSLQAQIPADTGKLPPAS